MCVRCLSYGIDVLEARFGFGLCGEWMCMLIEYVICVYVCGVVFYCNMHVKAYNITSRML